MLEDAERINYRFIITFRALIYENKLRIPRQPKNGHKTARSPMNDDIIISGARICSLRDLIHRFSDRKARKKRLI
jgi:hypothetical protein